MIEKIEKWFFEKLVYSARLQQPKHLGREYLDLYEELRYLHGLRPPIDKLPEVEKQKKELEEKVEGVENKMAEYFRNSLPLVLTRKYLNYIRSRKECKE